MAEPTPRAPLSQILHRLETIEQAVRDLEDLLVVVVEQVHRIKGLHRTDHHGVGRGGLEDTS